jgi:SAM-dependent methyltransferase
LPDLRGFSHVDATGEAECYFAALERAELLPHLIALRERSYELLHARPGDWIVDVGCGTGNVVSELTERSLKVTGVDVSEQMVMRARNRFPACEFWLAAAESLPFSDHSVQGYRAERTYEHIVDPSAALAEARRVLAPGGRLVLVCAAGGMWAVDSEDQALNDTILRALPESVANPWMGQRSRALLLDAGFIDVGVEVQTVVFTRFDHAGGLRSAARKAVANGAVSSDEADGWLADLRRRDALGRFLFAAPFFLTAARQP